MAVRSGGAIPKRVAILGNSQPRQCGIATFTSDLTAALSDAYPATDWPIVAMNDRPEGYHYPEIVRFTVAQHDPDAYVRAADVLNRSGVHLVLVQHEYGIFGGSAGEYLLPLLARLRMPIITTFHTILGTPDSEQRRVMVEIARLSRRVITMSRLGEERLHTIYGLPRGKIRYVPHGIPDVPLVGSTGPKTALGFAGRPLMLTFGLLSSGKGIESAIRALPAIVARHPDFVYLVVGATHPHVKQQEGERYRDGLLALAERLGVRPNVVFHDRFVALDELIAYIAAADIYVTPYLGREQIVSGTLAYTLGAGKAIISTPYPYAEELLAEGRGVLVPFGESAPIAEAALRLLADPGERLALRRRAYHFGRAMTWPSVARAHMALFDQALGGVAAHPAPAAPLDPVPDLPVAPFAAL